MQASPLALVPVDRPDWGVGEYARDRVPAMVPSKRLT